LQGRRFFANGLPFLFAAARRAGMNDCLAKPMDPEKLRQILKKYALCRELANLFVCVTW